MTNSLSSTTEYVEGCYKRYKRLFPSAEIIHDAFSNPESTESSIRTIRAMINLIASERNEDMTTVFQNKIIEDFKKKIGELCS